MENPIATLPFLCELAPANDADGSCFDVCPHRTGHILCKHEGQGNCDTATGVCYGCGDVFGGKLCARHFYEAQFRPHVAYLLIHLDENGQVFKGLATYHLLT